MASTLAELTTRPITVLTCDGRLIFGTLKGYDQLQNLILQHSYEKVYSLDSPMEKVELGLFVVKGDNVAVISDCDGENGNEEEGEEEDIRAEPIREIAGNR